MVAGRDLSIFRLARARSGIEGWMSVSNQEGRAVDLKLEVPNVLGKHALSSS